MNKYTEKIHNNASVLQKNGTGPAKRAVSVRGIG